MLDCNLEDSVDVGLRVSLRVFNPGNSTDDVRAQLDGLEHKFFSTGVAKQTLLWKGNHLQGEPAAELLSDLQERLHTFESRLRVDIGEGAHVRGTERQSQVQSPARVIGDADSILELFNPSGPVDSGHGPAHHGRGIRP